MYQSYFDFSRSEEIESGVDEFYSIFVAMSELQTDDQGEFQEMMSRFLELGRQKPTLLYLLEITKRVLVDRDDKYGKLILITSYFNKLIENGVLSEFEKDDDYKEYKENIINSILCLLPYSANYFQETNQVVIFDHLFQSLLILVATFDDKMIELFNSYIDSLLNDENQYKNYIAMRFANKFILIEEVKAKFVEYIKSLLIHLPECDLNNELERDIYQLLFIDLHRLFLDILKLDEIKADFFFQSFFGYFDAFISKFNPSEKVYPNKFEIKLTNQIIMFCDFLVYNFNCYQMNDEIISFLVQNICLKALDIIKSSRCISSGLISKFLLKSIDYLDFDFIEGNISYFLNLVLNLSLLTNNIFDNEDWLFLDYYDIDYFTDSYLSNRQNIARFLYEISTKNKKFICYIIKILNVKKIHEAHFFLLTIVNNIISLLQVDIKNNYKYLYQILARFLKAYESLSASINYKYEKYILDFSFFSLINSSFNIIKMNSDDPENIVEFCNVVVGSLMENIQKISEEPDSFYRVYFTFYCILVNNLIDNNFLSIDMNDILQFTGEHINNCITNSGIKLMCKLAIGQKNQDLFLESFNAYIEESLEIYEELVKLPENKKNEIKHSMNLFSDNAFEISNLIKNVDASDFNENTFEVSEENKLLVLANILISSSLENIDIYNWNFSEESNELFTALFENVPNLSEWTHFYISRVSESDSFNYGKMTIPIIMTISNRYEIIDQEYYAMIISFLREFIESDIEEFDGNNYSPTDDFLMISTLVARFFELGAYGKLTIPPEDFNYFIELSNQIQPTDELCKVDTNYNKAAHEIGAIILRLASFMLDQDKEKILSFIESIVNDRKIVCQEMRYLIIFLINNVLNDIKDEQLQKLESLCLTGKELQADEEYQNAYCTYISFLFPKNHPIFKLYPIEGFVNDEYFFLINKI